SSSLVETTRCVWSLICAHARVSATLAPSVAAIDPMPMSVLMPPRVPAIFCLILLDFADIPAPDPDLILQGSDGLFVRPHLALHVSHVSIHQLNGYTEMSSRKGGTM